MSEEELEEAELEAEHSSAGAEHARSFKCPICHKEFTSEMALRGHLRVHGGLGGDTPRGRGEASEGAGKAPEHVEHIPPYEPIKTPIEILREVLEQSKRWGLRGEAIEFIVSEAETTGFMQPTDLHNLLNELSRKFTGIQDPRIIPHIVRRYATALMREQERAKSIGETWYWPTISSEGWGRSPSYTPPSAPSPWRGSMSPPYTPPPASIRYDNRADYRDEFISYLKEEVSNLRSEVERLREERMQAELEGLRGEIERLRREMEEKIGSDFQKYALDRIDNRIEKVGDRLERVIIGIGTGKWRIESKPPELEEVEDKASFEDYLPPEYVEEVGPE